MWFEGATIDTDQVFSLFFTTPISSVSQVLAVESKIVMCAFGRYLKGAKLCYDKTRF